MSYLVTILIKKKDKDVEHIVRDVFELFGDDEIKDLTFENDDYSIDILRLEDNIRFDSKSGPIEQSIGESQKEGLIRIFIQRQNDDFVASIVDANAETFEKSINEIYMTPMEVNPIDNIDDNEIIEPESEPESEPEPESVAYRPRTSLYWTVNKYNYSIAVVTKHGVFQVKRCDNSVALTKRIFFPSVAAWTRTLQEGGNLVVSPPKKVNTICIARRHYKYCKYM